MNSLVTIAIAAVLISGCGGGNDEPAAERYGDGDAAVQVGGDTPDDFPDNIPLPEGAEFISGGVDAGFSFHVDATSEDLVAFYEGKLPGFQVEATGDEIVDQGALDFGVVISWDEGEISFVTGDPGIMAVRLTPQN